MKLDHKRSGISVDVCINNSSGLSTGKLVRGFVRDYPPLRPLTIVLKIFLVNFSTFFVFVYFLIFFDLLFLFSFAEYCTFLFWFFLSNLIFLSNCVLCCVCVLFIFTFCLKCLAHDLPCTVEVTINKFNIVSISV